MLAPSIVCALLSAALTVGGAVPQSAATAPAPFPNGVRCAASRLAYGDVVPQGNGGSDATVVHIARLLDAGGDVRGYVYRMSDRTNLLEPLPAPAGPASGRAGAVVVLLPERLAAGWRVQDCPDDLLTPRQPVVP